MKTFAIISVCLNIVLMFVIVGLYQRKPAIPDFAQRDKIFIDSIAVLQAQHYADSLANTRIEKEIQIETVYVTKKDNSIRNLDADSITKLFTEYNRFMQDSGYQKRYFSFKPDTIHN